MKTNSTAVLQHYLLWISVTLGANLHYFAALASKCYTWEEAMMMRNVTTRITRLLICSGSGEASGLLCQPMRFSHLRATA